MVFIEGVGLLQPKANIFLYKLDDSNRSHKNAMIY
jgi:hypothetical protein